MNDITKYSIDTARKNKNLAGDYIIEKSKDNRNILRISKEGKKVYMGSRYNSLRDIKALTDKICEKENSIIIIFGLGSGEYINYILNNNMKFSKLVVIEPDLNSIECFRKLEYFKNIVNDERFYLCYFSKKDFYLNISKIIEEKEVKNISYEVFANYDKVYSEEFTKCTEELQHFVNVSLSDLGTTLKFSKLWFECYVKNLRYIVKSTPVKFFNMAFENVPCVIVSAGPSLTKNIKYLKEYQDKCIIICCGRTVKPLLELGIIPDFLCIIDPDDIAYKQVKDSDYSTIPLVYFERTNWKAVQYHTGYKIVNSYDKNLKNILKTDVGILDHGGSVAHNCLGLAVKLGCNPIMMIGQDFAYSENKTHAECSVSKNEMNKVPNDEDNIFVKDIYGSDVKTSPILNLYRKTMEQMVKIYTGTRYINCTEGGANIAGTEVLKLKDSLMQNCLKTIDKNIKCKLDKNNNINIKNVINELTCTVDCGESIIEICKKAINGEKQCYEYIDEIEKLMNKNFLLMYLYKPLKVQEYNYDFYEKLISEIKKGLLMIKETLIYIKSY